METAIVSLLCISLIFFGGMNISQNFLQTTDSATAGFEEMNEIAEGISNTMISVNTAEMFTANDLRVHLINSGQTRIADFADWDVIVEYWSNAGGGTKYSNWYSYTDGAIANNKWIVRGIYIDTSAPDPEDWVEEVFDEGVLNPGEELVIEVKIINPVKKLSNCWININTPNGISASSFFTRLV